MTSTANGQAAGATQQQNLVAKWAQRGDKIFLTIQIQDCKQPDIKFDKDKLVFKGKSDSIQKDADHAEHELTVEFYKSIKPDDSKHCVNAREVQFTIMKEEVEWWPRLLKDSKKQHWLKIDFLRWKDEDDTDDEAGGMGMGMPGMPGMAGMPGMGDQPDFSEFLKQMNANGGGLPEGDEEEESDDDDTGDNVPDLE